MDKVFFFLCFLAASGESIEKKRVKHQTTIVSMRLRLEDIDLSDALNNQFSREYRQKADAFCSSIEDLFQTLKSPVASTAKYTECHVKGFQIGRHDIKYPTIDFDLSFDGRMDDLGLDKLAKWIMKYSPRSENADGRNYIDIGHLHFHRKEPIKITDVSVFAFTGRDLSKLSELERRLVSLTERKARQQDQPSQREAAELKSLILPDSELNLELKQIQNRLLQLKRKVGYTLHDANLYDTETEGIVV